MKAGNILLNSEGHAKLGKECSSSGDFTFLYRVSKEKVSAIENSKHQEYLTNLNDSNFSLRRKTKLLLTLLAFL